MAEPYNWLSSYQRAENIGNALADSFRTGNLIQVVGKDGRVGVGTKGNLSYIYAKGNKKPYPVFNFYEEGHDDGQRVGMDPIGTSRSYLVQHHQGLSPANRASLLQAHGYDMPLDVTKLAEQETPEYKEEQDLISRARLRMAADAKPLNPLGSTALKVGFYEGPLDWYKRKGFTNTSIKDLQTKLRSAGYEVGDIDGIMGPKTLNAIKQFQKDNNLTVDGLFGNNTKGALDAKLAEITPTRIETPVQALTPPAPVKASDVPVKIAGPAMKKKGGIVKDKEPAQPIKKVGDVTYTQKNDSSFVWNGPNNSAGEIRLYPTSGKEPDVTYRQYDKNTGDRVMVNITDPTIRQKHIGNVQSGGFKVPGLLRRIINRYRGTGELKTGGNVNYQKIFR